MTMHVKFKTSIVICGGKVPAGQIHIINIDKPYCYIWSTGVVNTVVRAVIYTPIQLELGTKSSW